MYQTFAWMLVVLFLSRPLLSFAAHNVDEKFYKNLYYAADECLFVEPLEPVIDLSQLSKSRLVWYAISKSSYLRVCFGEPTESSVLIQKAIDLAGEDVGPEERAAMQLTYATTLYPSSPELGCPILERQIANLESVSRFTRFELESLYYGWCESVSVVERFDKLFALYAEVSRFDKERWKARILESQWGFFYEIGQYEFALNAVKSLVDLEEESDISKDQSRNRYMIALAHLKLGQYAEAEQALKKVAPSDMGRIMEFINITKYRLAFEQGKYEQAIKLWNVIEPYSNKLLILEGSFVLSVMKAIACQQLNDSECVNQFLSSYRQFATDKDWTDVYLPRFLMVQALREGNLELSENYSQTYRENWFNKWAKSNNSELITAVMANSEKAYEAELALKEEQKENLQIQRLWILSALMSIFVACVILIFSLRYQRRKAQTDSLTKVLNRRAVVARAQSIRNASYSNVNALILLDIDNFKAINDSYGHPAGDVVLQAVASIIQSSIRKEDILGRVGGEEFMLCIPNATANTVQTRVEHIRQSIECQQHAKLANHDVSVTASFGIALHSGHFKELEPLYSLADKQLYESKHNGKNRASFAYLS